MPNDFSLTRDRISLVTVTIRRAIALLLVTAAILGSANTSLAKDPPAKEHWSAIYIQGKRVGYTRGTERTVVEKGQAKKRLDAHMVMKMTRFGTTIETKMDIEAVEDSAGNLESFETSLAAGQATMTSTGTVRDGKLFMGLSTLGRKTNETLEWTGEASGFFAREQSLESKPMKPGQTRTIKMLVPMSTALAEVQLKAVGYEVAELLDGKRELLRIDALTVSKTAGQEARIQETLFADDAGVLMKAEMPSMQQVMYRTTKEIALGDFDPQEIDLGNLSIVKVKAPADLLGRKEARYQITFKSGDPSKSFAGGGGQSVRKTGDRTAEIVVAPTNLVPTPDDQPTDDDRNANGLIQSDDPNVRKLAANISASETDATRLAKDIEKFVFNAIEEKNFSQAFASAAEVAEQLQGDCTEHAVLLAAIARARGLPARVAVGLVYVPRFGGFGYHMWSEVWTGKHWLPLDGTLGRGGISPGHIKITHSNLKGAGPLTAIMPVVTVMGNVSIRVAP